MAGKAAMAAYRRKLTVPPAPGQPLSFNALACGTAVSVDCLGHGLDGDVVKGEIETKALAIPVAVKLMPGSSPDGRGSPGQE